MRIPDSSSIHAWDAHSVRKQGISFYQLMQHAAWCCVRELRGLLSREQLVTILCGPGNNGGDGLLIAAYLHQLGYDVQVFAGETGKAEERRKALEVFQATGLPLKDLKEIPTSLGRGTVIDALFGHGLSRPLEGIYAQWAERVNQSQCRVISIDVPSGMPSEPQDKVFYPFVHSDLVLSFQSPKQSFYLDEYAAHAGQIRVLDIGLDPAFSIPDVPMPERLDEEMIRPLFYPKQRVSHKGDFGEVLIVGGNRDYGGAVQLAAAAALHTGVGKTFVATATVNHFRFAGLPEAILVMDCGDLEQIPAFSRYPVVGIGPGLGKSPETARMLEQLFQQEKTWIIDADALNLLAEHPEWSPKGRVVITPHPGEFDRLTGPHDNTGARWKTASLLARERGWIVVLKGSYTSLFFPDGRHWINTSGNSGLAKGGSGDVLCGLIAGWAGRGGPVEDATKLAVYLHGSAADRAVTRTSRESMRASDILISLAEILAEWEA